MESESTIEEMIMEEIPGAKMMDELIILPSNPNLVELVKKVANFQEYGIGYRVKNDPLFAINDAVMFKPFVRLGVYRYDDENLCHKSNCVRCNIPNCTQEFETIFAYENHYNSLHRFLCGQCSKNLPSAHLLDLHLSEMHDSFFAVQAERKPMFRCFLEECSKLSQNAAERRDHCITEHKFPHDFRFDPYKPPKKNTNKPVVNVKSSVLQSSKMVSGPTHDEDIELENKSILLTAQRKPFTNFSFGHKKSKAFRSNGPQNQSYAKQLTAKSEICNKQQTGLDNTNLVDELMESLPQ